MKPDLKDRKDIELLVNSFYDKVKQDTTIGYIFNDVAKVDWAHHLPIMYSFWEMLLFGTGSYKGDTMSKHIQLDKRTKLEAAHFEQWLRLFKETIDTHFEGPKVEEAKERAQHIAGLMQFRIQQSR